MTQEHDDRVRYVYAQLKALVDDLPEIAFERDVERYHDLIDELASLGYQADLFRIDKEKDMFRPVASSNSVSKEVVYHNYYRARHGSFGRQVKALFTYFELTQSASHVTVTLPR